MTSACVVTEGFCGSSCLRRSSTVRMEPETVRPAAVVTTTRAPCNWPEHPGEAAEVPPVAGEMEKGMSAMRAEGGAREL